MPYGGVKLRATKTLTTLCFTIILLPSVIAQAGPTYFEDSGPNNLDLTANGSPNARTSLEARYKEGINLDGSNDYASSTNDLLGVNGDLSLLMAFELDNLNGATILTAQVAAGQNHGVYAVYISAHAANKISYTHEGPSGQKVVIATNTITTGFHWLWLKRDATARTIKMVIDGVTEADTTYTSAQDPNTGTVTEFDIATTIAHTSFWDGSIAELRIWTSVKTDALLNAIADPDDLFTYCSIAEGTELALYLFGDTLGDCEPPPPVECEFGFVEPGGESLMGVGEPMGPSGPWIRILVKDNVRAGEALRVWAYTLVDGVPTEPQSLPLLEIGTVTNDAWEILVAMNMTNVVDYTETLNEALYYANWTVPDTYEEHKLLHFEVCAGLSDITIKAQTSRSIYVNATGNQTDVLTELQTLDTEIAGALYAFIWITIVALLAVWAYIDGHVVPYTIATIGCFFTVVWLPEDGLGGLRILVLCAGIGLAVMGWRSYKDGEKDIQ